ncbi:hypothetical protein HAX54_009685 [Datura stramonium]|uniref:Protein TIC 20 n=1 Tax=Datura stramonium TaxID=4076 RepID=A0ABS8TGV9_DATST|nr:hypothetical protein [Datura stramonium]
MSLSFSPDIEPRAPLLDPELMPYLNGLPQLTRAPSLPPPDGPLLSSKVIVTWIRHVHRYLNSIQHPAPMVVGTISRWMPLAVYWGKVGMHFWTAIAFAYLFTVLESIRCAHAGMYSDIPFVCDAAL